MSKRAASNYLTHDNWDQEDDDDRDETGVFKNASETELQKRTIIKAKRKIQGGSEQTEVKSAFSGFSFGSVSSSSDKGFPVPTFSFAPKAGDSAMTSKSEDVGAKTNCSSAVSSSPSKMELTPKDVSADEVAAENSNKAPLSESAIAKEEDPDDAYLKQMKQLNQSFYRWISECIVKNPECILTPCFDDYMKYVDNLDKKYPSIGSAFQEKSSISTSSAAQTRNKEEPEVAAKAVEPKESTMPTFSFLKSDRPPKNDKEPLSCIFSAPSVTSGSKGIGSTDEDKAEVESKAEAPSKEEAKSEAPSTSGFPKFGFGNTGTTGSFTFGSSSTSGTTSSFTFGVAATSAATSTSSSTTATSSLFSFGSGGKGFSGFGTGTGSAPAPSGSFGFGAGSSFPTFGQGFFLKPADSKNGGADQTGPAGGDDEDYEPPKVEVVENSEEGAFHTVRCKLYYKKGEKFEERGVGFLYLKPNGTKTQLLVRTDTALGNILLNVNVEKLMPVSRQGKNNITIICVPNPPVDPKADQTIPVPMLIRVKTEKDADKLFEEITNCQAGM